MKFVNYFNFLVAEFGLVCVGFIIFCQDAFGIFGIFRIIFFADTQQLRAYLFTYGSG
jgi:hypothetical protein